MTWESEKLIFSLRVRKELEKLNAWQKFRIRGGKKHYLYHEQRENWTGKLPIYLFGAFFAKTIPWITRTGLSKTSI